MNSRIEELAKECGAWNQVYGNRNFIMLDEHFDIEKFAKLIVRECIERITNYDLVPGHSAKWEDIYDIHARLLQDLGEELKEHFGVEE
jgi:hypothetical protein